MPPQNSSSSYQFAPSSMEGWNDCPVLPHSLSGDGRKTAGRRSRRPVHVSHLGEQGRSPSSATSVATSSGAGVSRLPPTRTACSVSQRDGVRQRVQGRIDALVVAASTLPAEQHAACGATLADSRTLEKDADVVFLDGLFAAWDAASHSIDDAAVVDLLHRFADTHAASSSTVAWLAALKTLMAHAAA